MKNDDDKDLPTNQVCHSRVDLWVGVSDTKSTQIEFTVEVESNDLTCDYEYTDRQFMVYKIIRYLHQEVGLGYRRISTFMNSWGIKTDRGKEWKNTHVYSVLKRFRQREERINNQRKKKFPNTIGTMTLKPLRTQSE